LAIISHGRPALGRPHNPPSPAVHACAHASMYVRMCARVRERARHASAEGR